MTAKIKLNAASGGGSFSLQAPSSSSNNRVFTLPDSADATILTSTTDLGKLVHYENIIWNGHASIGATTSRPEISSSIRFTYTPTSATNKIILRYNLRLSQGSNFVTMFFVGKNVANYSNMQNSEYVNSPATLVDPSFNGGDGGNAVVYGGNSTNGEMHQIALMAIETAGNTNQRIYSVHCKVTSNTAHFNRLTNNSYYGTSFAELFEVTP